MESRNDKAPPPPLHDPTSQPDTVNDPEYNTYVKGKEKEGDDVDTCRICRGEGTPEESLFYPCKCSGSIRFVHQNCLMEWLAHSQKKHCELCKTPFRFTKLYHPQMPSTVPIPVFLHQAVLHGWAHFQTLTRFQMVFFVWVFWLPWCMRTIWRGLFWVGDGAWVDWSDREIQKAFESYNTTRSLGSDRTAHDVHLLGSKMAALAAFMDFFGSKATRIINSSPWRKEPISLSLVKRLYNLLPGLKPAQELAFGRIENATKVAEVLPRSSTWLSDVPYFSTMTRSTTINNVIIDTLEGQLITLFVVVTFILIFLIREWVMQQQQNMLLGPGGNNEDVGAPNIDAPAQQQPGQEALDQGPPDAGPGDNGARPRLFARPRRRVNRPPLLVGDHPGGDQRPPPVEGDNTLQEPTTNNGQDSAPNFNAHERRRLPPRKNEKGELVHPPTELKDVLQQSSLYQQIRQRIREDPTLDVMNMLKNELPTDELNDLMHRLGTPGILPYMQTLDVNPQQSSSRSAHDGNAEDNAMELQSDESRFANDKEDHEFLRTSQAEIEDSAMPHHDFVTNPRAVTSEQIKAAAFIQASDSVQNAMPQDAPEISKQAPAMESFEQMLPSSGLQHQPPSQSLDDPNDDLSDVLYTPQDSSDEASQAKNMETAGVLIDEREMMGNLNVDGNASSGTGSGPDVSRPPRTDYDDIHDEEHSGPVDDTTHNHGYLEAIKDWLWGGISPPTAPAELPAGDEERIVDNLAEEEPFVPVAHGQHLLHPAGQVGNQAQDPEVLAAAAQAGIDPNEAEGVDEMEDLEGIMELVGMEGPLAGLLQNGMFCAVLVSMTILFGVWVPYMFGKVFLTLLAGPVAIPLKILRVVSAGADMVVDTIILVAGGALYWTDVIINLLCRPAAWVLPVLKPFMENKAVAQTSASYAEQALNRLLRTSVASADGFYDWIDIPIFSVIAHESLQHIELQLSRVSKFVFEACQLLIDSLSRCTTFTEALKVLSLGTLVQVKAGVSYLIEMSLTLAGAAPLVLRINPLKLNLAGLHRTAPLDLELAAWNATDRAIAVIAGYTFFALLGVAYLYVAGAVSGTDKKGAVNGGLAQVLYQAGGVMKVILIISIEMIVFPLYCGMLLDVALLPLFGNVTVASRITFAITSPWTSIFVHWFVGTCYMFHFALFVSMCRKIMRTGVLCMSHVLVDADNH